MLALTRNREQASYFLQARLILQQLLANDVTEWARDAQEVEDVGEHARHVFEGEQVGLLAVGADQFSEIRFE